MEKNLLNTNPVLGINLNSGKERDFLSKEENQKKNSKKKRFPITFFRRKKENWLFKKKWNFFLTTSWKDFLFFKITLNYVFMIEHWKIYKHCFENRNQAFGIILKKWCFTSQWLSYIESIVMTTNIKFNVVFLSWMFSAFSWTKMSFN